MNNLYVYVLVGIGWIGHAAIWTALLNHLYGQALPKRFLKLWFWGTGLVILAFPLIVYSIRIETKDSDMGPIPIGIGSDLGTIYTCGCVLFGGLAFPVITAVRLLRQKPRTLLSEHTHTHDFWPVLGEACRGDGSYRSFTYLPFNGAFRVDVTELTLWLARLPLKLDGLSVLVLSDLHLHGSPSRQWYDAVFDELAKLPTPDVIALVGDYVDTDTHHQWLAPLLSKLKWNECGLVILGNHDKYHYPEQIRTQFANLGYRMLGNRWQEVTIRGERVIVIGNEMPWFRPAPDLASVPTDLFRLCLSHGPDQFVWAAQQGIDLTLSGHTHGGAIRIPVIGSIFIPCTTGRRYDAGVFEKGRSVLVVGRGLSGKEPLRFRCNPQVLRLILRVGPGTQ